MKTAKKERWKRISEFPHYAVSDRGRVKRVVPTPMPKGGFKKMRILKPQFGRRGYPCVLLYRSHYCPGVVKTKHFQIHRLVMLTFGRRPKPKEQVNHKNGIKTDNRLENLEWCTASENLKHAFVNKLRIPIAGKNHWMKRNPEKIVRGEKHSIAKLTESNVIRIRKLCKKGLTQISIANQFSISQSAVSLIYLKKNWKHIP